LITFSKFDLEYPISTFKFEEIDLILGLVFIGAGYAKKL
jgi:hypothetical protein